MQHSFIFHPTVVLRTPTSHFGNLVDESHIVEPLSDPSFAEALYIASPTLYQQSQKWLRGQITDDKEINNIKLSVAKYLNRKRSRCTPFGLFASSTALCWGQEDSITLEESTRHTRLTMGFLRTLAKQLSEHSTIRPYLYYYPNNSLYAIGNEARYIEYSRYKGRPSYQISSVMKSEEFTSLLAACRDGLIYHNIIEHLVAQRITAPDAQAFVDELIQAQILVSELEPTITGVDLLQHIIKVLCSIKSKSSDQFLDSLIKLLKSTESQLEAIDQSSGDNLLVYQHIINQVKSLKIPNVTERLFQVNTFHTTKEATIDRRWQKKIEQAMEVLTYFAPPLDNQRLKAFKRQFYERYEEAEMHLLSVLDTETGIGYGDTGKERSSMLIEGLSLARHNDQGEDVQEDAAKQWLHNKVRMSQRNGNNIIKISKKDINSLPVKNYTIPVSTSVIFRFFDQNTIYLEGVSGTSATNLLGRFANDNEDIYKLAKDIATTEQEKNPDVIFAEIVHLPAQSVGNILRRPTLHNFELPYLAQSTLPRDQQIALHDLFVSIRNGQVILRSKRLNKEVIPRLSAAHNYVSHSLPVYHFLCALQTQGVTYKLNLTWHPTLYNTKRLPRVVYNNTILGLATWYLSREDFVCLKTATPDDLMSCFKQFKEEWQLPRYFVLVDQDQELLIDTYNNLTINTWVETIKKREAVLLREFPFNPEESKVVDRQHRSYTNQFIASLIKTEKTYTPDTSFIPISSTHIQRTFMLGSEWLYFKFYSGIRSSDKILLEAVKPFTETLLNNHQIDQWFFVRYADPDDHLRVRLHLKDPSQLSDIIKIVSEHIQPFEASGHIWKSQTDTYRREIERYGAATMEVSEELFFVDSVMALQTLAYTQEDTTRSQRWLRAIKNIHKLLSIFGYKDVHKHNFVENVRNEFYKEFEVDRFFKRQVDARYRNHQDLMKTSLQAESEESVRLSPLYSTVMKIIQLKKQSKLETASDILIGSYIHMHINRLISTDQRLHELVIYDFLARYYKSELAKS